MSENMEQYKEETIEQMEDTCEERVETIEEEIDPCECGAFSVAEKFCAAKTAVSDYACHAKAKACHAFEPVATFFSMLGDNIRLVLAFLDVFDLGLILATLTGLIGLVSSIFCKKARKFAYAFATLTTLAAGLLSIKTLFYKEDDCCCCDCDDCEDGCEDADFCEDDCCETECCCSSDAE